MSDSLLCFSQQDFSGFGDFSLYHWPDFFFLFFKSPLHLFIHYCNKFCFSLEFTSKTDFFWSVATWIHWQVAVLFFKSWREMAFQLFFLCLHPQSQIGPVHTHISSWTGPWLSVSTLLLRLTAREHSAARAKVHRHMKRVRHSFSNNESWIALAVRTRQSTVLLSRKKKK